MNKKLASLFLLGVFLSLTPLSISAVNFPGLPPGDFLTTDIITNIFNFVWYIFSGFAVIMFIVAGFLFLTAQGNPEKVSLARKMLIYGGVGVAVALLSVSIPWVLEFVLGV